MESVDVEKDVSLATTAAQSIQVFQLNSYLQKKGDVGMFKTWKQRWFSAEQDHIYYSEDVDTERLGCIVLDRFTILKKTENNLQFEIGNKYRKRVYYLQAPTKALFDTWVKYIQEVVAIRAHKEDESKEKHVFKVNFQTVKQICVPAQDSLFVSTLATEFDVEVHKDGQVYSVGRRYSDLLTLHKKISVRYETVELPPFPPKTILRPSKSELESRRVLLNGYFAFVCNHPDLSYDEDVRSFFHLSEFDMKRVLLTITVLEARYLVSRNQPEVPPSCSCLLTLYDSKFTKLGDAVSTAPSKSSSSPVWNEDFYFEPSADVAGISVAVWNSEMLGEEFMGRASIPLNTIPANKTVEHWFPLHPTWSFSVKVLGDVKIRLHYKNIREDKLPIPERIPSSLSLHELNRLSEQEEERKRSQTEKEKMYRSGEVRLLYCYNPPRYQWEGSLIVQVVSARDLETTSSSLVTLRLDNIKRETTIKPNTSSPNYKEEFFFYVNPHAANKLIQFEISVYSSNLSENQDTLIGNAILILNGVEPQIVHDKWFVLCSVPTERNVPKKFGKKLAEQGYEPGLPIVLIPGIASSGLQVTEGYPEWINQRIWLSLGKIGSAKFQLSRSNEDHNKRASVNRNSLDIRKSEILGYTEDEPENEQKAPQEEETPEDTAFRNRWVQHMCLQDDGCSDPPGIKVRAVPGKDGVNYLTPGAFTSNFSFVMGPLLQELYDFGYTDDNLACMPYDWRLPPHFLQERDNYFTELKSTVEQLSSRCNMPVVLVCHSMGCKVVHYFLAWLKKQYSDGQEWIDKHIHTFFTVGAPWLGAPKVVRALITGERFGLNALLNEDDAIRFMRSLGSTTFLFPMGWQQHYFENPEMPLIFKKGPDAAYHPSTVDDLLVEAGAQKQLELYKKYYLNNEYFGGTPGQEVSLQPPPVKRLYCIYGVNIPTEVAYFYKKKKGKMYLGEAPKVVLEGYKIEKGTVRETKDTRQKNIKYFTGIEGYRSGDGTVPYQSLNYCAFWRKEIPELRIEELPNVEHRAILGNRMFFQRLIEYVAQKRTPTAEDDEDDLMAFLHDIS